MSCKRHLLFISNSKPQGHVNTKAESRGEEGELKSRREVRESRAAAKGKAAWAAGRVFISSTE